MSTDARLPLTSMSISDDRLEKLKDLLPEAFTEGRVDVEKLRLALGEAAETGRERYGLNWAGKSEAVRTLMAPGTGTLKPCPDESVDFDTTENLIIEGDNLEVLKLLQKSYYGKVKLIYIDPPYNTGNDFIYPDDFRDSLKAYQRYTGQLDEEGNATSSDRDRSGRFHSNWLNMMYPRLHLARNLLREDGVIFVSIDDNEVHNLRMLMNEVFGEENFVACFVWKRRTSSALADRNISTDHDYVVCYQRQDYQSRGVKKTYASYKNPDNDSKGPWMLDNLTVGMNKEQRPNQFYDLIDPRTGKIYKANPNRVWAYISTSMNALIADGRIIFPSESSRRPMLKRYKSDLKTEINPVSTWISDSDIGMNSEATRQLQGIFEGSVFSYAKPVSLISEIIRSSTEGGDIIIDFFGGSGTTAHAVIEQNEADGGNRKFILVQLPEPTDKPEYPTIAHITRERVRRVISRIKKAREEKSAQGGLLEEGPVASDLGFRALRLEASNFRLWDGEQAPVEEKPLAEQLALYADHIVPGRSEQDILFELILKSGLPLSAGVKSVTLGAQAGYAIEREDKAYLFCLANPIHPETLAAMLAWKPAQAICLDAAFAGRDDLKANTVLQMRDAGIRFQTA